MSITYLSSLTSVGSLYLTGLLAGWAGTPAGDNRNLAITEGDASPAIVFTNDNKEGLTS